MNFKGTKASLAIIIICCVLSLLGTTTYLEPIQSSLYNFGSNAMSQQKVEVYPIDCPSIPRQRTELPLTYEAVLPVINEGMIHSIVSILSGLPIVNIDKDKGMFSGWMDRQRRQYSQNADILDSVVAIQRTQYPYSGDKHPPPYYSKEGGISRAFIVVQNPLRVISHRFRKSGEADWRKWSEVWFDREVVMVQRFLCHWFDRYTPQSRVVISYEDLFTDQTGISTIMTLNNFLGGGVVDTEIASCLWRGMMSFKSAGLSNPVNESVVINQPLPEQQPTSMMLPMMSQYPYTAPQLNKLLNMMEELSQRYKQEETVHMLLMHYHEEVRMTMSQLGQTPEINEQSSPVAAFNEPLEICGRPIPFPLSTELQIAQHYSSQCPLFAMRNDVASQPSGMLLIRGYDRFGRTGNNLIEFLHALQYGREKNVILGIMLDSWPMALITKFWMAFPTDNMRNEEFLSNGILEWKDHIEQAFCIKVFLNEEELVGYDNIIELTSRELFMFRYEADAKEYIQFQLHNIRKLFRSCNFGVGKDIKNRDVGNLCSVIDGVFGDNRQFATYSVIHSRSLEGAPGLRLLGILSGTSGCDPVAALNMEPEYIKAILSPLGLLQHPILFISDNQRPDILEKLMADADIGSQIRLVPSKLSWVGGDLAVAIMANAFIGNPASTFSGFISKSRIALGFDNNFLFRVKKDGEWVDSCEDRCIFYKWVMRSMA